MTRGFQRQPSSLQPPVADQEPEYMKLARKAREVARDSRQNEEAIRDALWRVVDELLKGESR